MAAVVLENYAEMMDYNFSKYKEEMYAQYPSDHPKFIRVEQTNRAFEQRGYIGGLGLPMKNRDLEEIPFVEPPKGPTSRFIPVNYRLGYQIDRQSVEDEQWGLLANRPKSMLYGSIVIKDLVATDILNNGFVLQSYDLSGTSLFGVAHPREDGAATWINQIAEVQPITVETVFNAITNLLALIEDSKGLAIGYTGTYYIYVPMINAELWEQAVAVVNSTMNPNTSDHRINSAMKSFAIEAVPLRYLTNSDIWFIGWDPNTPNYGLVLLERVAPTISPLKPFGDNEDAYYSRLRQRFTAGYENKRGIAAVGV
jgi:hypothetical protein